MKRALALRGVGFGSRRMALRGFGRSGAPEPTPELRDIYPGDLIRRRRPLRRLRADDDELIAAIA
jgi:hypothetical protein